MLRHHKLDSLLVLLSLLQVVLLALPFFVSMNTLALCVLGLINIFLIGTNYQCVAHNFIHLPFFKHRLANNVFSILNGIGLGIPQSIYRVHHLDHHRHNNKPEHDETSTFRHGKEGREENIFSYSFLGIIRTDLVGMYKRAHSPLLVNVELIVFVFVMTVLFALNWKLFLGFILPTYYLGQTFAMWENYCEHHHANPYDRKRDSVSCYNSLYNLIWFNNGYHQEHHFAPQVHWTKVSEVKSKLPEDRVIVNGCHLLNSFK